MEQRLPRAYDGGVKLPKWIPDRVSWLTAAALLVYGVGVSTVFAFAFPILLELATRSPRLGWLGILIVWLAPIPVATLAHRVLHRLLDAVGDRERMTTFRCWWAGLFAWAAIIFVTMTTSFILLVLDPPPVEPEALWRGVLETSALSINVRTVVWLFVAVVVVHLERSSRGSAGESS
jgi:hypothetical protein